MYIRYDGLFQDGNSDGAKAWRLLQQNYSKVENPTIVSLVKQLLRLQLEEEEKLHKNISYDRKSPFRDLPKPTKKRQRLSFKQ